MLVVKKPSAIVYGWGKIGTFELISDVYFEENLQDKVCMISNSDIYLYECCLECFHKLENNIYALSRYEHDFSCPQITNFQGSHDVFIFNSWFCFLI